MKNSRNTYKNNFSFNNQTEIQAKIIKTFYRILKSRLRILWRPKNELNSIRATNEK